MVSCGSVGCYLLELWACHAIVIMDAAGWHTEDIANEFNNVSIIKLASYSPKLNPIEQVWSWLRQRYLVNQFFTDYDIVAKVCDEWNLLQKSSHQDVLKKMDRPDLLIFQIGITQLFILSLS